MSKIYLKGELLPDGRNPWKMHHSFKKHAEICASKELSESQILRAIFERFGPQSWQALRRLTGWGSTRLVNHARSFRIKQGTYGLEPLDDTWLALVRIWEREKEVLDPDALYDHLRIPRSSGLKILERYESLGDLEKVTLRNGDTWWEIR